MLTVRLLLLACVRDDCFRFHRSSSYMNALFDGGAKEDLVLNASHTVELRAEVMGEGRKTIERLVDSEPAFAASSEFRDLRFSEVKLKNFGPYGASEVSYPLSQRGLVLLRGRSSDGTGADSNGSGKVRAAERLFRSQRSDDVIFSSFSSAGLFLTR